MAVLSQAIVRLCVKEGTTSAAEKHGLRRIRPEWTGRQSTWAFWACWADRVSTYKCEIPTAQNIRGSLVVFLRSNAARHGVLVGDDSGDFRILRNRGVCYPKADVACPKLKHVLNNKVLAIVCFLGQIVFLRLGIHLWIFRVAQIVNFIYIIFIIIDRTRPATLSISWSSRAQKSSQGTPHGCSSPRECRKSQHHSASSLPSRSSS